MNYARHFCKACERMAIHYWVGKKFETEAVCINCKGGRDETERMGDELGRLHKVVFESRC